VAASSKPDMMAMGLTDLVTVLTCLISIAVALFSPLAGELVWVAFLLPNLWIVPWLRPLARRLLSGHER
jgi:hypothetical protein